MRSSKQALARNLAQSLTRADWSVQTIRDVLTRRLPPVLALDKDAFAQKLIKRFPTCYAPTVQTVAQGLSDISEFDLIYRYCLRNDVWPSPDLTQAVMAPSATFAALDIPDLATISDLAEWLMCPEPRLTYLADVQNRYECHDNMAVNHYHYHLKTKAKGVRLIEAPKAHLKSLQRRILSGIIERMPVHDDAFGFVKGRNCLQAAQRHVGEEVVVNFDIASFFPSINAGRVFGLFRCLGYPESVARCLTGLCTSAAPSRVLDRLSPADRMTFRAPHLPQGAPTSPALANQMAYRLDCRLSGLARNLGAHYSRYADDMSFSGDRHIADILVRAVPGIVADEGFQLNPTKTRVQPYHVPQRVTGIGVNRHLNVDRAAFDRIKAVIHACGKPGDDRLQDAGFCAQLLGRIGWVEAVNPARGSKLRVLLERSWDAHYSSQPAKH